MQMSAMSTAVQIPEVDLVLTVRHLVIDRIRIRCPSLEKKLDFLADLAVPAAEEIPAAVARGRVHLGGEDEEFELGTDLENHRTRIPRGRRPAFS